MAQTNYTPISLYYSATASATPTAGNLVAGELALNTNDGKLFYKDSSGVVQTLASKAGNVNVSTFSGGTTGLTPNTATTGAVTLAGTLNVANGGTGLTTLTAGYIPYGNGTSAFGSSSNLFWDGTNSRLGIGTTTPGVKIDIIAANNTSLASVLRVNSNNVAVNTSIAYDGVVGSGQLTVQAGTSSPLIFGSNATEQMRLTSAGYLGIGTSSPTQPVQLTNNQNGSTWLNVVNTNSGSGAAAGVLFTNNSGDYGAISLYSSANPPANALVIRTLSTNPLVFGTNSIEVMRLDSSGNLGLGVTPGAWSGWKAVQVSPIASLASISGYTVLGSNWLGASGSDKYITTDYATRYLQVSGQHQWQIAPSGTAGNAITFTTGMTLDNSGNLLVGTTSNIYPAANRTVINVNGTSQALIGMQTGGTAKAYILHDGTDQSFNNQANGSQIFYTNTTERMRIDSSGNLLVGKTTASETTGVGFVFTPSGYSGVTPILGITSSGSTNATDTYHLYSTGASAFRFYVDMAGTVHATSIVITAISDERLKENIKDLDTGLSTIMALKPRRFDWKEGKGQDKKNAAGFIAQEFQEVLPNSISTFKAGGDGIEYLTMNHEELIPTLVKAIQELSAEVNQLKQKLGV
jgi:hypothetical protein